MPVSKYLVVAALLSVASAGAACTNRTPETDHALDATREAGKDAAVATEHAARVTADKAQEVAVDVAAKSKEVAAATSVVVTDAWLTTKVKAKIADEIVLKGSDISVETTDRVVTLSGSVRSEKARARAGAIATGTEHVARVVNDILVKEI